MPIRNFNKFVVADAVKYMRRNLRANSVDLTVTSPPYENLRDYNGYAFDPKKCLLSYTG